MSEEQKGNATFYAFKDTGKYYTLGRGTLSKEVFAVFAREERLAQIYRDNDGCWPGLSGTGGSFYRMVVADESVDHGYPLMFKPT
jgi:hypothetical protein